MSYADCGCYEEAMRVQRSKERTGDFETLDQITPNYKYGTIERLEAERRVMTQADVNKEEYRLERRTVTI